MTKKQLRELPINYLKLRWINGDELLPYHFWLENKITGSKYKLETPAVEKFLKENHVTTNDFRNYKERELTEKLVKELVK